MAPAVSCCIENLPNDLALGMRWMLELTDWLHYACMSVWGNAVFSWYSSEFVSGELLANIDAIFCSNVYWMMSKPTNSLVTYIQWSRTSVVRLLSVERKLSRLRKPMEIIIFRLRSFQFALMKALNFMLRGKQIVPEENSCWFCFQVARYSVCTHTEFESLSWVGTRQDWTRIDYRGQD